MEKIYLYDGSFEGFLTIVFNCFKYKFIPKKIKCECGYSYSLFEKSEFIETDYKKSDRVLKGIENISEYGLYNVHRVFLSNIENKENIILDYIINLFRFGEKVNYMRNIPSIVEMQRIVKNVGREAHRFKGFVRFEELSNGIYYSKIEPDNNILEIISPHFMNRLKNEYWIIHDTKRNIASFYNKNNFIILSTKNINFDKIVKSSKENEYEKLWKSFYENINIKERKNLKCRMNFMPKKYWKNLTEMKGN